MSKSIFTTKDVTTPKDGLVVYKNVFWLCDGDATKALFYGNSPQCNQNIKMMEWALKREMYQTACKDLKVIQIETAYVPQRN